ncbi:MAG: tripartite tricarboxylate transporter permease [Actinomycetota bacterium]
MTFSDPGGIGALLDGFSAFADPRLLMWALLGVLVGTVIGVLPGIGPAMTVALLLPLTFRLDAASSLVVFGGIYYGAMYGGSTTSILLKTPGEAASIVTAIDGHHMARQGRGAQALATAAIGSFIAGLIATGALVFIAEPLADQAIKLRSVDYFALIVFAFVMVSAMLGDSKIRGLASLAMGLTMGLIGIDPQSGQSRFTLGTDTLLTGIDVIVAAVGLFAVGEALYIAGRLRQGVPEIVPMQGSWWRRSFLTGEDLSRSWRPWLRGTAIGFPLGVLPAGGPTLPTFLSYAIERRLSRRQHEFGRGAIEGVAGPEAANNAAAAGTLVPLLTLGLPTSATAAVLLVAFQQYGIQPGPLLFDKEPELVWSVIASLLIGNLMLLVLNLPLVGLWVRLLEIPRHYLYAGILMFSLLGAYAAAGVASQLIILVVVGVLGVVMRRFGYPIAPAVIGLVLGPTAEEQLNRALNISNGDVSVLVSTWPSMIIYSVTLLCLIIPAFRQFWSHQRAPGAAHPKIDDSDSKSSLQHDRR